MSEIKFDIKIKRVDNTKRFAVIFEGKVVGEIYRKTDNFWRDSYGEYHGTYGDAAYVEIRRAVLKSGVKCEEAFPLYCEE